MSSLTSATGTSVVTARYILGNPRTAYGVAGTGPALTIKDISLCEYWDLNDGAESISAVIGLQYSSTSPCNTNGYITDAATLVVAHHNGTAWENLGASGATLTNMTAATASTFSPFTIGTTNAILNPLPVSFTNVKAFEKGTGVQIEWTNSTESDMSAYIIERSSNGIDFTAIGQTAPRSNQFDRVSYSYTDATPLAGTNFYRVKAIELSGKNVYTKSLRVDIGRSPKGISLYPNPVRGSEITIGFTAMKGQYSLNVLNTAGQVVYRQALNHAGGTVAQSFSLPASLKAGVYNVLISGDNYKETRTFVIQ
ncbi:MAG TPA: T9SS type A sorting domain-containing protein, partial [Chitinophagaceae bacterium]|nr:T9SS type A sorting domain-containing protein [Chitinophagaceae bacterium]